MFVLIPPPSPFSRYPEVTLAGWARKHLSVEFRQCGISLNLNVKFFFLLYTFLGHSLLAGPHHIVMISWSLYHRPASLSSPQQIQHIFLCCALLLNP